MLTTSTILQDRYRIVSLLGQGGMGAVYRAWDTRLNVPVALKEMIPQPGLDPQTLAQLRQQFQQEALVLARLNHPHLVRVTDFFEEHGNTYLAMDFVKGESLADRITRQGPLPEWEVLAWAGQLLDALAYCHTQGVLHRDIKPQNVIIRPDGQAVLVDFGLVKLWDPGDPRTKTAMRGMGTPEYAPPEQYETEMGHTDARSDIYSLGATLYHALAGQAPPTATLRMAAPEQFVPVRTLNPNTSAATETTVLRAMELARLQRWHSADEMAAALGVSTSLASGQPPERVAPTAPRHEKTRVIPAAQPPATPARRRVPTWAWVLGGLAVIVLCVAMVGLRAVVVRRARAVATAQARATATAQSQAAATMRAQATITAQARATATAQVAQATTMAQLQATATAQAAQATATAQAARATATAQAQAAATAVADAGDVPAAASDWPIVLSDPFDPNVNDWPVGDYSDERVTGNRLVTGGTYRWQAEALDGVIWWSIPDIASVSDFYLTAEARRVNGVEDGQYGVILRRADRDNYGLFKIEDSQYFKFSVRYEGEWETVVDWTEAPAIRPGEVNRLTVIAEGSHFTFYINDEYVGEASDDRLTRGQSGLAIELLDAGDAATFEFDNFEVRAP
jgi:tRNA A-37 threonylcarbamoyl transferase component Bud32